MKTPTYLKKGDTVGIICTARSFSSDDAQEAIRLFESWGLHIELGSTIDVNVNQLGGTDEQRAADLQQMLDNPNIKAIWIARGGYGTVRIIDKIDFTAFLENPKWLIGFSDITVLHNHIHNLGVATLHAIMPYSVPRASAEAKETLKNALFNNNYSFCFPTNASNKIGAAEGLLVGGNLSIIYSLLGSKSSLNTHGKILYLEDLDEYLYHIDRMFYNLKRNGYFDHLAGLIIGGMTDMHDNQIPFGYDVKQIVLDICKEYHFPICFDFPAGHISNNRALKLGTKVGFEVTNENTFLTYL
ncbi:LD-carboxypeptidase [Flavobacterium sp. xlx-214]|uniref:S66 peptidase family protein n=1 Tax=unclassified Flavobacterium TaxID=196869 RepID=UPI0013D2130E|nr:MULTISPECIES: LD-carboxypeptidase [unclassified Flavobacterium]MBA5791962.1 LD-carboxypeptidase [Flavobacterium sp. xlx-221]QMI84216.1 LD-carboxypeptidase [Flavobacterium sp. xlx-214]